MLVRHGQWKREASLLQEAGASFLDPLAPAAAWKNVDGELKAFKGCAGRTKRPAENACAQKLGEVQLACRELQLLRLEECRGRLS